MSDEYQAVLDEATRQGLLDAAGRRKVDDWLAMRAREGIRPRVEQALIALRLLSAQQVGQVSRALASSRSSLSVDVEESVRATEALARKGRDRSTADSKYDVRSILGRGGVGEVHLAIDRFLRREVAIKTLRAPDRELQLRRFLEEAQITGQLEHPGIVPLYEYGVEEETGQPYMVMRRIRGQSLADVLDAVRSGYPTGLETIPGLEPPERTLERLLEIFLKACDAVAYANSRGVVHRDLKPANIMADRFGEVLVLDWGLAKVVGHSDAADGAGTVLTNRAEMGDKGKLSVRGQVLGSPYYMSPEQARGEHEVVDRRTDVYGMGAVLYEILSLEKPVAGNTRDGVLSRVESGAIASPTSRSRAPWRFGRRLDEIVLRAMAKDPDTRFDSVDSLKSQVETELASRSRGSGRGGRSLGLGAAALVSAALTGFLLGWLVPRDPSSAPEEDTPEIPRARTDGERPPAASEVADFDVALAAWDRTARIAPEPREDRARILEQLTVVSTIAASLTAAGEPDASWGQALVHRADRAAAAGGAGGASMGAVLRGLSELARSLRRLPEAARPVTVGARAELESGWLACGDGHWQDAITSFSRVIAPAKQAASSEVPGAVLEAYVGRGLARWHFGDVAGARADLARAVDLDPDDPVALDVLGRIAWEEGDTTKAVELLTAAVQAEPLFAEGFLHRGLVFEFTGRTEAATADYLQAIHLIPSDGRAHFLHGDLLRRVGRAADAQAELTLAVELLPKSAEARQARGLALLELGQARRAEGDFSMAVQADPRHGPAWLERGRCRLARRDDAGALADFDHYRRLGFDSWSVHADRAVALVRVGRRAEAEASFEVAAASCPESEREAFEARRAEALGR